MESKNRNTVVIVFVVVAILVLLCCLAIAIVAAATGFVFPIWRSEGGPGVTGGTARTEQTFDVGSTPELQLDSFSGSVVVRVMEGNQIRVVATKQAAPGIYLDRIEISYDHQGNRLVVQARKPATVLAASVQFEITVPPDTQAELHTGSGTVSVEGLQGGLRVDTGSGSIDVRDLVGETDLHTGSGTIKALEVSGNLTLSSGSGGLSVQGLDGDLEAHTGSGTIDVAGAAGQARLDTGSGGLVYDGTPRGECRFETGSGGIVLRLPVDLDARVDLSTGSGRVAIDFPVDGEVGSREVKGVIGSGEEATLFAHTGTGNVEVTAH